jgi:hypothetical protein
VHAYAHTHTHTHKKKEQTYTNTHTHTHSPTSPSTYFFPTPPPTSPTEKATLSNVAAPVQGGSSVAHLKKIVKCLLYNLYFDYIKFH